MISQRCREHCASVGETPIQHLFSALWVAIQLQTLVLAVIVHAFVPRWFTLTATRQMKRIIEKRQYDKPTVD
jgi:hypothetical protein